MKNYLFLNLSKIFSLLLSFLGQFILIRIFAPNDIGIVITLSSISTIFTYTSDLGLTNYYRRILPLLTENKNSFQKMVFIALSKKIISFIFFSSLFILINLLFGLFSTFEIFIILFLSLNLSLNSSFVIESKGNFKFFSIIDFLLKTLNFSLLLLFLITQTTDYFLYFFLITLLSSIVYFFINLSFLKNISLMDFKLLFNFSDIVKSFPYLLPSFYAIVYGSLDKLILGFISNPESVFIHTQALFITSYLIILSTSISSISSPKSIRLFSYGKIEDFLKLVKQNIKNINIVSFPIIIGFSILIFDFSSFYFNSFSYEISITSIILVWDVYFNGIFYLQMEQIILSMKKIYLYNFLLIVSILIIVPVYLITITIFGYLGAAISIVFTRLITIYIANLKINNFKLSKIRYFNFKYLFFSLMMGILVFFVKLLNFSFYLSIFVKIIVGLCSYTLFILLNDNDIYEIVSNKVKIFFRLFTKKT